MVDAVRALPRSSLSDQCTHFPAALGVGCEKLMAPSFFGSFSQLMGAALPGDAWEVTHTAEVAHGQWLTNRVGFKAQLPGLKEGQTLQYKKMLWSLWDQAAVRSLLKAHICLASSWLCPASLPYRFLLSAVSQ